MDASKRQITKIAREAAKLTIRMMKETGIGTGEFDLIHAVRHHPGISQKEVCALLNMDKGAVARRVASLEGKGYLVRHQNPADSRGQMLYATEKAESLKRSKVTVETAFYAWLLEGLSPAEQETFTSLLHTLYVRSKTESRSGFPHVTARLGEEESV
ncbi:MarR family winged helix-turn-helix transcriptional regulator [uncultured Dysosmobacter sp.]|uniref:MarR family winged helix-turn-helix transcriptional regulator n=1 Tax=uncultured Dysosmobacter sp. TaxID=2591384 RepID=UPI0026213CBB|nr:MarR family winged helix-turn-helix transcriptional regulator [uncultured Dysosmobacter sp.]